MIGNLKMSDNSGTSTDHAIFSYSGTARDADTPCDSRVRANVNIMRDLYLIIEPDALLEHGVLQCATIDGCIGTNIDVITNPDTTELRHIQPPACFIRQPESITANDRTCCNPDAFTDRNRVTDHHIGRQSAVSTDNAVSTDKTASRHLHAGINHRPFFNDTVGTNPGTRSNAALRIEAGAVMYTLPDRRWR